MTFGETLRELRESRHISQSKLARNAGFDHSFVSRLESGARDATRETVERLVRHLALTETETRRLFTAAGFVADMTTMHIPEYPYIVIADETGGYCVFFPDCPGCMTQGDDFLEVAYMARDALQTWCESEIERGHPLPLPSVGWDVVHAVNRMRGDWFATPGRRERQQVPA